MTAGSLIIPLTVMLALFSTGYGDVHRIYTDNLIEPGVRIGPVDSWCSRENLAEQFGERKLLDATLDVGEGTFLPATVIKGGSGVEVHVIWADETMEMPAEVWAAGEDLRTAEGIGIGTTLAELEELIGPFELLGFAWDYEGTVFLEGTTLSEYDYDLIIRLSPGEEAVASNPEAYEAVMGDRLYSSSDPAMRTLNPVVYDVGIIFR